MKYTATLGHEEVGGCYLTSPNGKHVFDIVRENGLFFLPWYKAVRRRYTPPSAGFADREIQDPFSQLQYDPTLDFTSIESVTDPALEEWDDGTGDYDDSNGSAHVMVDDFESDVGGASSGGDLTCECCNASVVHNKEVSDLDVDSRVECSNCCYGAVGEDNDGSKVKPTLSLKLLHRRFAHFNSADIVNQSKYGLTDFNISGKVSRNNCGVCNDVCESCRMSKATRHNPPKVSRHISVKPTKPFQSVWSDVKGPLKADFWGNQYMVTFTCEVTRWTVVAFCKHKDQILDAFERLLKWCEIRGWRVEQLTSDNGGEYTGGENAVNLSPFGQLCQDKKIVQRFTVANTSAQNGISERVNRTLCDNAAATLFEATLDYRFWSLAVKMCVG